MIDKDSFLDNFRELFDETDLNDIQMETYFKNLDEWSSLIVLSLIVQFEDTYKVKLAPSDINNCATVEDLYKLAI